MLEKIDFEVAPITKEEYKPVHDDLVNRLVVLQQQAHSKGIGLVVLFEGWNGAGKGGRISDLLYKLDARATSVHVTDKYDVKNAKHFRKMGQGVTDYYPQMKQYWEALDMR
ncbi:MAG: polyphosphate--AMP phosphotransferase, partial [Eggerthellaceae bacterium]|nr:polyphosphate--AMP phosphotransferase [Eggerthellaceae bacterium]